MSCPFWQTFRKSYQEYSWLQESARDFPDKETLANEFQAAGFGILQVKSYAGEQRCTWGSKLKLRTLLD